MGGEDASAAQPSSWGELLDSYRQTCGSRSMATFSSAPGAAPAVRCACSSGKQPAAGRVLAASSRGSHTLAKRRSCSCWQSPRLTLDPITLLPRSYTRSVAGVCPLAEVRHPLYAVGVDGGGHAVSELLCSCGAAAAAATDRPHSNCRAPLAAMQADATAAGLLSLAQALRTAACSGPSGTAGATCRCSRRRGTKVRLKL